MSESRCRRCSGTGEIAMGGAYGRFVTCTHCQGEGVVETHDKKDGTSRDTSFSPAPQRDTQKF